ncbi:uncharacterized protein EV420DRAFT_1484443 [Desarmillaria tabescens]|uniref:Uncharacterized protein n=1 Tax=Armillaria tabescens TaxID=1929756 RepID=A0AA39JLK9_ARMTA|nr:uncharacterized protein EV420DRAFT_1484443 [Desarmillaria tabescens]KAK0445011.1 hypothetical protein EV420DRAFT_1484443 [Desarmillaria tabescens]
MVAEGNQRKVTIIAITVPFPRRNGLSQHTSTNAIRAKRTMSFGLGKNRARPSSVAEPCNDIDDARSKNRAEYFEGAKAQRLRSAITVAFVSAGTGKRGLDQRVNQSMLLVIASNPPSPRETRAETAVVTYLRQCTTNRLVPFTNILHPKGFFNVTGRVWPGLQLRNDFAFELESTY